VLVGVGEISLQLTGNVKKKKNWKWKNIVFNLKSILLHTDLHTK